MMSPWGVGMSVIVGGGQPTVLRQFGGVRLGSTVGQGLFQENGQGRVEGTAVPAGHRPQTAVDSGRQSQGSLAKGVIGFHHEG